MWKYKRPGKAKAILRKNNGAGGIDLSKFRLYHKAAVINIGTDRNLDQWNRIESPEINPSTYGESI